MAEVPAAVFGRNLHEQQVQFYRADIVGGMTGDVYVGRVSRNTVLLNGGLVVKEAFSGGNITLTVGETEFLASTPLNAAAYTSISVNNEALDAWTAPANRAEFLRGCWDEVDIIAHITGATTESSGVATIYLLGIEPRVSNEIFTQYPFEDTSRMATVK